MKNKGFTLVELLAVIVVLSIIALIGYSTVGNIISSSQDSSNKITMKNYAKAVDQAVFLYEMNNSDSNLSELNSTWLKENVKFEKSTVECEYATYDKTSSLYGCKVKNNEKTYCYTNNEVTECNKNKLSKIYGNSIQNGTPTPTSPVEIQSVGERTRNLINLPTWTTKTLNGITITLNSDGSFTANGTATANAFFNEIILSDNLKNNQKYTISCSIIGDSSATYQFFMPSSAVSSAKYNISKGTTFTAAASGKVNFSFVVYKGITVNNLVFKPQLEEGSTATDYEPYGYKIPITVSNGSDTKTTNIYLKEPLRKVGEYADYLDLTNKKVVRNVKEKVLSSSDRLSIAGRGIAFTENVDIIKPSSTSTLPLVLCSHYNKSEWSYTMPTSGTKEGVSINSTANLIGFYDSLNTTSLEKFKAFLDSNEVKLNYLLATPTEESVDIPEIPSLTGNVTYSIGTSIKPNRLEYGY